MRLIISPTAYKGTFSPHHAARTISSELKKTLTHSHLTLFPLADGGDGTFDVLRRAYPSQIKYARVKGPHGKRIRAKWAFLKRVDGIRGPVGLIEMAQASGLAMVKGKNKILEATSYGTGQLIKAALDAGCRSIWIGIGGTATSDAGAGALNALGIRFLNNENRILFPNPASLIEAAKVETQNSDPRLKSTKIMIMCDVTNPLLGMKGSARVFGPQKGASQKQIIFLEKFFKRMVALFPRKISNQNGMGAAGGIGFGLAAFTNAKLVSGIDFIMRQLRWNTFLSKHDVIVTGEGTLDQTSFYGKVPGAVCEHRRGRPVIVICGQSTISARKAKKHGIIRIETLGPKGRKKPVGEMKKAARRVAMFLRREQPPGVE